MRVKICGITSVRDAVAAAEAGADFIGLIRAASARAVAVGTARDIVESLAPFAAQPVLLVRDAPLDAMLADIDNIGATWLQLHGNEPVAHLRRIIDSRPPLHLIKAWEVRSAESGNALLTYVRRAAEAGIRSAAGILDAPKGGPHPGFDYMAAVSRQWHATWPHDDVDRPELWCAGGLTPDSLVGALADGVYDGIDVARGVETQPGVKDHAAMRRFIGTTRNL